MIASNNDWVIPAGLDERRFFVLEVSNDRMQDHEYFKELHDEMNSGGREAMLYELLNVDLSGLNLRCVPQTTGLFEQKLLSADSVTKFWFSRLQEGSQITGGTYWSLYVETRKFYDQYVNYARNLGFSRIEDDALFSRKLRQLCFHGGQESPGIRGPRRIEIKTETSSGRKWCLEFPDLQQCQKRFEEASKCPVQWQKDKDD
jgi:hypothetical protein